MAATDTSSASPGPQGNVPGAPVPVSATVSGGQTAAGPAAAISAATFELWLAKLSPAQLRSVLAETLAAGALTELPAAYQVKALDLAPEAAQLAATAQLDAYSTSPPPPLIRLNGGRVYWSAGGEQYRMVPDADTFDSLGLTLSAVIDTGTLALPQAAAWPHLATPADAFTQAGAIVAGRGSIGAAVRFAATWLPRVAA